MRSTFPPRHKLIEEMNRAKERLNDTIPKEYAHNDFHIKNIVYNDKTGTVYWIVYRNYVMNNGSTGYIY